MDDSWTCDEKRRLIVEFTIAATEFLHLQSQQIKSVALGDGFGFEEEIKTATTLKDDAKRAILKHQTEHGC